MKVVTIDELKTLVSGIFQSHGVPAADADMAASCMVHANARGVDSHGVLRVAHYIKRIETGSINPTPSNKITRTSAATAMLDGDDGLGHVSCQVAMQEAIKIAEESGVGFVGVNNSSHCGALSFHVSAAIEAGKLGMAFSQTDKRVTAFGGKQPFFGTNPLCIGAPSSSGQPVMLDMATSLVAWGHIVKAQGLNKPVPEEWGVAEDGSATTDPHKMTWLAPAAGPKGYGLGAIVDIMTGLLCGGAFGPHVVTMYGDYEQKRKLCHMVAAIDYKKFAGAETFLDSMKNMIDEMHQVPPAEGFQSVLAPGEPEYLKEQDRKKNGIPIDDHVWEELNALAS
ncbi:MAG: Ldh family oxidoreductase [Armatimonadota bacterium]